MIEAFCIPIEGVTMATFALHLAFLEKLTAMRVTVARGTGLRGVSIAAFTSQGFVGLMTLRAGDGPMGAGQRVNGIVLLQAKKNGCESCFAVAFGTRGITIMKLTLMRIVMAVSAMARGSYELPNV